MAKLRWRALSALSSIGFLWLAYGAAERPIAPPRAAPAPPAPPSAAQAPTLSAAAPPAERFAIIGERPLFAPSRRPPSAAPKPVVSAPPPTPAPDVALTGVAVTATARRAVLSVAGGPDELVAVGDRVGRWRVVEIGEDGVTFALGDRRAAIGFAAPDAARAPERPAARAASQRQRRPARRVDDGLMEMERLIEDGDD